MRINIKRTKVLKISKGKKTIVRNNIGGKEFEQVKEFCCLGSMHTADAKCHGEIKRTIAIGKEAFLKRRGKVNRTLKIRMSRYGSKTWTLMKKDIKRPEAFEMWI